MAIKIIKHLPKSQSVVYIFSYAFILSDMKLALRNLSPTSNYSSEAELNLSNKARQRTHALFS